MLQASSSAPSLATSPYASTMSAESAMLLREIDSLEWMIDGVCFEYTPWDRRRSVAKVTSVAVHKPLPHVWRAARRALSSKHFRDLLQRHLAPVSLSPKEFGALIDIFGGERGTIDSSDFAVFYGGLADVLRRAAPLPRLPSRPPRKPAVPRRHPYERFLSLFRHEVHYLRSGATLWHGAGPASPVFFSSAPAPDLFP